MTVRDWLRGARPWTLVMGASPVVVGAAASWPRVMRGVWGGDMVHVPCPVVGGRPVPRASAGEGVCVTSTGWFLAVVLLCLVVSVGLQIAANFLNDYADGVRGVDRDRGVPDASSAGAPVRLVASGTSPRFVLHAALSAVAVAALAGITVVVLTGHMLLFVVGALCAIMAWAYSGGRRPGAYRGWGEAMAFLFFGPVACVGTQWALMGGLGSVGGIDPSSVMLSIVPGCCSACLMMVNNLRDRESDGAMGKRTLMVRMGEDQGAVLFALSMAVATVVPVLLFALTRPWSRLGLTSCGVTSSGDRACSGPSPAVTVGFWLMSVLLVALLSQAIAGVVAVRRRLWRRAFLLCVGVSASSALVLSLCVLIA